MADDCTGCVEWQRLQRVNTKLRIENEELHEREHTIAADITEQFRAELDQLRAENEELRQYDRYRL